MNNIFGLQGKTALVTGCSKGIGRSMAVALAEAGADIIGVSSSLTRGSEVEAAVRMLGRGGGESRMILKGRRSFWRRRLRTMCMGRS